MQSIKNIRPFDLVYPGALLLFFGFVIIVFFFAIRFISQNINRAFSSEDSGASQMLNIDRFKLTAKKLNIPVTIPQNGTVALEIPVQETVPDTTSAAQATSTLVATVLDKSAITIIVKNSTSKKGVAGTLAKSLEDSGFQKPQTGNESKLYATTTVLIKASKQAYEPLLLDTVRKTYPDAVATTTETGTVDATVIIGTH